MKPHSLGDLFYACYYARDPVMLKELSDKADSLQKALESAQETEKQLRSTIEHLMQM